MLRLVEEDLLLDQFGSWIHLGQNSPKPLILANDFLQSMSFVAAPLCDRFYDLLSRAKSQIYNDPSIYRQFSHFYF